MKFTLEIESENAAFSESPEIETARLLRQTADRLETGDEYGKLMDYNGNGVGFWDMETPDNDSY